MIAELQRVRDVAGDAFTAGAPLERVLDEVRLACVDAGLTESARVLGRCITNGCELHEASICRFCKIHLTPAGEPARL